MPLFNNISVISLQSVLLVDETGPGVPRENHWPVASHWQTLSHNIGLSTPRHERVRTHKVSGDRHWLHKSNYHTITTTHKLYIYLYKDIHKNKKNNYLYYLYIVLLYSYNYYPIKIIHDITWSYFIISVWYNSFITKKLKYVHRHPTITVHLITPKTPHYFYPIVHCSSDWMGLHTQFHISQQFTISRYATIPWTTAFLPIHKNFLRVENTGNKLYFKLLWVILGC
jgi:hypothetical protein